MNDFFDPPAFGASLPVFAAGDSFVPDALEQRTFTNEGGGDYAISAAPWGTHLRGFLTTATGAAPDPDYTSVNDAIEAAQSAADTAQTAFDTAVSGLATAQAAYAMAQAALVPLEESQTATAQECWKAGINLHILTARGSDLAAAQARRTAAIQAANVAAGSVTSAQASAEALLSGKADAVTAAMAALAAAKSTLETRNFERSILQANASAWSAAATDDGSVYSFQVYEINGSYLGYDIASGVAAGFAQVTDPATGAITNGDPVNFYTNGEYHGGATLSADQYAGLAASALVLTLQWSEVTRSRAIDTDTNLATGNSSYAHVAQSEPLSLADATQNPDGTWTLHGATHAVAVPALGSNVTVMGLPGLPTTTPSVQYMGDERFRQGWQENATPGAQASAARYRTITASGPPGSPFAGTIFLAAPPTGYDPYHYPPLDGEGNPTVSQVIRPGDYAPTGRPLVLFDDLSAAASGPTLNPASLVPPSTNTSGLTPNQQTFSVPAGLVLTKTGEETTADIVGEISAILGGDWPEPDPVTGAVVEIAPSTAFPGAQMFTSRDGDHVVGQKMRFKLSYQANSSQAGPFTTVHRWRYRHRNLDTGAVCYEDFSASKTWPVTTTTTNADGSETTQETYTATDADWTEVSAAQGETVELVMLPGENADPSNFSAAPAAALIAAGG